MINIQDELETGLEPKQKRRDRKLGVFYPSEALICNRRLYYRLSKTPQQEDSTLPFGLFKMGVAAELAVIEALTIALEPKGYSVESQKRAFHRDGRIEIHGYADFVITAPNEEKYVGEIKSTTSKSQLASTTPQAYHDGQLQCYLGIFGIDDGCVLYVDRSDILKTNQIDRSYEEDIYFGILDNFDIVLDSLKDKEAPEGYKVATQECRYCEYRHLCSPTAPKRKSKKAVSKFQSKLKELNGK